MREKIYKYLYEVLELYMKYINICMIFSQGSRGLFIFHVSTDHGSFARYPGIWLLVKQAAVYFFINGNLARMSLWVVLIDINIASDTFAWI